MVGWVQTLFRKLSDTVSVKKKYQQHSKTLNETKNSSNQKYLTHRCTTNLLVKNKQIHQKRKKKSNKIGKHDNQNNNKFIVKVCSKFSGQYKTFFKL